MANDIWFFKPSDLLGPLVRTEDSFPYSLCTVINVCSCKPNEAAFSKAMLRSSTVIKDTLATDHQQNLHEEETLWRGFLSSSGIPEEHGSQFPS